MIDEQWARDSFTTSIFGRPESLDGDMAANRFRVDANGTNRFYKILNAAAQMLTMHEVDFNILTVLTGYAAENIDRDIFVLQAQRLQISSVHPCLHPFGDKERERIIYD